MRLYNLTLLFVTALLPAVRAELRQHTLELSYGANNADGITRESWLINGQTPGLRLVWDEDDDISVKVINKGHEPVSIHWHGIEQVGTPWSDGVPDLTQWPIPPQGDFFYNFTVKQAVFQCAIYIRPNPRKDKPFDQVSADEVLIKKLKWAENNALMLNVYDYKHYTSDHWMAKW
ncbi:hypothetical protein OPQ81_000558 [Rhizoctonia solani]|nr:hypothetical protein OPQ81_000558 [Rhizoctonia solani]